ncbi:hypothetical protein [Curtobacterium sp. VKM Ac-2922]|uniref:hypothetical protein n=1 Tax=Curtobacterium sp. VKM Ac-2922 TaxID=2929475 RepID=UPI001FB22122|nr:hypothetical protein [Curtobacterium sp. VKM Ac-2922]MCJ1713836.1 hypothetical protein [Curtobacterium sp. VKM Ac-2922]
MDTALIAAVVAAAASIAAAVVSWFGAFQARRATDRDHAWKRLTWAIRATRNQAEYDISRTVLQRLIDVPWAPKPDQELARRALRRHVLDDDRPGHHPAHDTEDT